MCRIVNTINNHNSVPYYNVVVQYYSTLVMHVLGWIIIDARLWYAWSQLRIILKQKLFLLNFDVSVYIYYLLLLQAVYMLNLKWHKYYTYYLIGLLKFQCACIAHIHTSSPKHTLSILVTGSTVHTLHTWHYVLY